MTFITLILEAMLIALFKVDDNTLVKNTLVGGVAMATVMDFILVLFGYCI